MPRVKAKHIDDSPYDGQKVPCDLAQTGTYSVVITGTGGRRTHTAAATLVVH